MGILSEIISVDPKCNHMHLNKRQREIGHRQKRRHCNYEGRSWTDVVTNQVIPAHTGSQKRQRGKGRAGFWSTPAEGCPSANTWVSAPWN